MMGADRSLDGLDLPALEEHLFGLGVLGQGSTLSAELISGGKSNLTYRVSDGTTQWVLRRPPLGDVLPGAHDMSREHRVLRALRPTRVPVPTVVASEEDAAVLGAPFYLMEAVPGDVYRTPADLVSVDVTTRQRLGAQLVDTLADLHEVDPRDVGLAEFGRPEGYLERQVARWLRQFDKVRVRDLPDVVPVGTMLHDHLPDQATPSIVHGDYRLDNVIVDPSGTGQIAAVLDWEMATLGDPLADLGTLIMFWDAPDRPYNPITKGLMAVEGFMTPREAAERYAARRGVSLDDFGWYLAFARFRLAIILEQIHVRHLQGQTRGEGFEGMADMVIGLLQEARQGLETGTFE